MVLVLPRGLDAVGRSVGAAHVLQSVFQEAAIPVSLFALVAPLSSSPMSPETVARRPCQRSHAAAANCASAFASTHATLNNEYSSHAVAH